MHSKANAFMCGLNGKLYFLCPPIFFLSSYPKLSATLDFFILCQARHGIVKVYKISLIWGKTGVWNRYPMFCTLVESFLWRNGWPILFITEVQVLDVHTLVSRQKRKPQKVSNQWDQTLSSETATCSLRTWHLVFVCLFQSIYCININLGTVFANRTSWKEY